MQIETHVRHVIVLDEDEQFIHEGSRTYAFRVAVVMVTSPHDTTAKISGPLVKKDGALSTSTRHAFVAVASLPEPISAAIFALPVLTWIKEGSGAIVEAVPHGDRVEAPSDSGA